MQCFGGVEHKSTDENYSLKICDVKIHIAFAESINQALDYGEDAIVIILPGPTFIELHTK